MNEDFPLQPLVDPFEDSLTMPLEEYSATMLLLNEALDKVRGTNSTTANYPNYFDELLSQLIDAVPLE